jgi:hypothetical protein
MLDGCRLVVAMGDQKVQLLGTASGTTPELVDRNGPDVLT